MVLRRDGRGVLAIGQPAHAWICGQLARAWGNERFGPVEPLGEVALGAEQHDVGMGRWDLSPVLHPATGLPQSFMEMGVHANVSLWRTGPARLVSQSRYAALLAAMHGHRLYERHELSATPSEDADAIRTFLAEAQELESSLLSSLRADPTTAAHATAEMVARNSRLVWTWDLLSLALLLDEWSPRTLPAVPAAGGQTVDVALSELGERDGAGITSLDPWPFSASAVRVRCEGRRLAGPCASQAELTRRFARAPWETVEFELVPVGP